jgi:hypothetical protein
MRSKDTSVATARGGLVHGNSFSLKSPEMASAATERLFYPVAPPKFPSTRFCRPQGHLNKHSISGGNRLWHNAVNVRRYWREI